VVITPESLVRAGAGRLLAGEEVSACRPFFEALPYPVMHIGMGYEVLWMNTAALADYGQRRGSCHSISHGRSEPCHLAGEPCPKLLAEERGAPTSVNHVHAVSGGVELFKVVALPLLEGGVIEMHVPLEDVLARDGLTGVYSRDFFWMLVTRQLALLQRMDAPFSVIMFDLDHFKRVNDEHGHAVGDALLRAAGGVVNAIVRASDTAGRIGGEEFAVFLPNAGAQAAMTVAERLRVGIHEIVLDGEAADLRATASFGVCAARPDDALEATLERADGALYRAKRAGRDRVELA
jgi:diguanylate cyclase (GGDEF)-like protein